MQYLVRKMVKQDDQGSLLTSLDMDYSQRVILLGGEINEETAVILSSALRALARESDEDITLYIQSPGGLVSAGLSIYDTMQSIRCDVATVACGLTGSMAALLLAAGAKGKRWAQPHAQILIHHIDIGQNRVVAGHHGGIAKCAAGCDEQNGCNTDQADGGPAPR